MKFEIDDEGIIREIYQPTIDSDIIGELCRPLIQSELNTIQKSLDQTQAIIDAITKFHCEHKEIEYCKNCVYYVCKKCKATSNVIKPLKFHGGSP